MASVSSNHEFREDGLAALVAGKDGIPSKPRRRSTSSLSNPLTRIKATLHRKLSGNSLDKSDLHDADDNSVKHKHRRFPTASLPPKANASDVEQPEREVKVEKEHGERRMLPEQLHAIDDDDNPWAGRAILSLDGGGMKGGLSSLLTLQTIMKRLAEMEENHGETDSSRPATSGYRPYHYFDLIGGSSTGGLIAIMLGRLRMTVDEALVKYKELANVSFHTKSSGRQRLLQHWKFIQYSLAAQQNNAEAIEGAFRDMHPLQSSPGERDEFFSSDPMRCKTVLCSMSREKSNGYLQPALFRSYVDVDNDVIERQTSKSGHVGPSCKIWEAALATSAAPPFFEPYHLDGKEYVGVAPFLLNPSWEVYKEFTTAYKNSSVHIDLFLSIGSDATSRTSRSDPYSKQLSTVGDAVKSSDTVDYTMRHNSPSSESWYRRVNVEDSTQHNVRQLVDECAAILVKMRRRRENTMQWERFAEGILYKCPLCEGNENHGYFQTRVRLKDHLQVIHGRLSDPDHHEEIQRLLNEGRESGRNSLE
jgi:hypothetical protein